jgi:hypothetical protein
MSPIDQNVGKSGGDVSIVRVERQSALEVSFGLLVTVLQEK